MNPWAKWRPSHRRSRRTRVFDVLDGDHVMPEVHSHIILVYNIIYIYTYVYMIFISIGSKYFLTLRCSVSDFVRHVGLTKGLRFLKKSGHGQCGLG